ncbi:TPR repeat protein [Minicystis rosea]|nr:TPR repeat protein [Minicystis rosea]
MAERDAPRPPSSRDIAGEDFLFHLYRGSELLQDNRVHDAKAELEQALSLQPSDPKGQDLLGIVYFRLGLYPRAISIYEQLIKLHPDAIEPRINLALSYLKTGQAAPARFELEKVVEQSPGHSRAWGYLGLAFQRLGDYERASYAFQAGGHDGMARRLIEMAASGGALSIQPEPPAPTKAEMRRAADEALVEIDRNGDAPFRSAEIAAPDAEEAVRSIRSHSGPWSAIEPGKELPARPPLLPSIPPADGTRIGAPVSISDPAPASLRALATPPRRPADLARDALLLFPRDLPISLHASGMVLVQAQSGFSTRLELVRSMAGGGQTSTILQRRARGRLLDEPLGGPASPLVELTGKVELVLGPAVGRRLAIVALDEDALYLREDALAGFESTIGWENGRLPVGDGDALPMVQLRGPGAVVATLPERLASVEVIEGRSTSVRGGSVLGWIGRVVPRALVASEAPAGVRGFVAFAGEGMVLLDER